MIGSGADEEQVDPQGGDDILHLINDMHHQKGSSDLIVSFHEIESFLKFPLS